MISATIVKQHNGRYKGFQISGHSGYDEEGKDIICAAVSCLTLNTINSIEALTEDSSRYVEEDGLLKFKFTGSYGEKSQLLMDSLVLGLTSIEEEYGKEYLKLGFKEV